MKKIIKVSDVEREQYEPNGLRNQFATSLVSALFLSDDPINEAIVLRGLATKLVNRMNSEEIRTIFNNWIESTSDNGFSGTDEQAKYMIENGLVKYFLKTKF